MTFADEWPQMMDDWHSDPAHNIEPQPDRKHHPLRVIGHKVADVLAWFGRPYVTWANTQYNMPSGVLFGSDGSVYDDLTVTENPNAMPAPPAPGMDYNPTGELVQLLPEGCSDCFGTGRPHGPMCLGWWCQQSPIHIERY